MRRMQTELPPHFYSAFDKIFGKMDLTLFTMSSYVHTYLELEQSHGMQLICSGYRWAPHRIERIRTSSGGTTGSSALQKSLKYISRLTRFLNLVNF